jgi:hypothetical protein
MEGIEPGSTKLTNVERGRSKTETGSGVGDYCKALTSYHVLEHPQ